ncbi:uncharacterized protein K02A2.6-like [Anopheles arabiensis]|uniref:uncharacterized protein K02A2.6-like n=1 Tax=Anopheles arabiensis TaxID=7173 RepID=UPI001AAD7FEB|nr:uncharacterized protein K02A2.6-like [Anopheles arabiensis]
MSKPPAKESSEQWIIEMFNQQKQMLDQQQQLLNSVLSAMKTKNDDGSEKAIDAIAGQIKEFHHTEDTNFEAWYSRYEGLFLDDAKRLDDGAKLRLLLRKIGVTEHERYISSIMPKQPKDFDFKNTVEKLKKLFGDRESIVCKRFKCLQLVKEPHEEYGAYACRVNKKVVEAKLAGIAEEEIKCLLFVCGLKRDADADVRVRLLSKMEDNSEITLDQLTGEAQRLLNLRQDSNLISNTAHEVNAVRKNETKQQNIKGGGKEAKAVSCWLCGGQHFARECSFTSHKCEDCNEIGHKEGFCETAYRNRSRYRNNKAKVRVVTVNKIQAGRKYVTAALNGRELKLQLDTGADITIISQGKWRQIGGPKLSPASVSARTASGTQLKLLGEFCCKMTINKQQKEALVRVVEEELLLFGADSMDVFGLWKQPLDAFCNIVGCVKDAAAAVIQQFPSLFSNELRCDKMKISLQLKDDVNPVFRPKRPVAYAMQSMVEDELTRLEGNGIITPTDSSEWAAPIVVVRKANGTVRICGDYSTGLNDALQPHQYPLPIPQDIFTAIGKSAVFSQIDLAEAFLQVEVCERSRELLTINTHKGLYRFNRLPPGVKTAPGAFQQIVDSMLSGLEGVAGYMDDIIVGGADEESHLKNLRAVLIRIEEFGFKLRAEKCSFLKPQIRYLGHLLDRQGIRPDPAKIEAILKMPAPTQLSEVRSYLGAINYYGKFVFQMRDLRYPLDLLLKKGGEFQWTAECEKSFRRFKEILSSDLLLTHYDPSKEIIVSADASSVGLGATISHRFPDGSIKVVQHAARALTKVEMNYSQPDREGLAIVFAVTKFHRMLFGRRFILQTDHQPLLRIFGSRKGIPLCTANRLQRWALALLLYDFAIEYVATDNFGNADILSRLMDRHEKPEEDYVIASIQLEDDINHLVTSATQALPLNFKDLERGTQADPLLRKVFQFVQNGWPKGEEKTEDLKQFFARREALSTVGKCLLFGERVVVPANLRNRVLKLLHKGHPGVCRMKALARGYVYWPKLDSEIENAVKTCQSCASAAKSPEHCTPVDWPKTTGPWQRIHVDYAGPMEGEYYFLVVDSYSKWPEIIPTRQTTAQATVQMLRGLCARFGIPETVVSDNGTQFTSSEFRDFCMENGIHHVRTAPYHPQSNGQAERFVDTFKRAVKKIREGRGEMHEALDEFLFTYRNTPNRILDQKSPGEMMLNRKVRTSLEMLRPSFRDIRPADPVVADEATRRSFSINDRVYAKRYHRNGWEWVSGVVDKRVGNVMYMVKIDGKTLRYHVNQLRMRNAETNEGRTQQPMPLNVLLDAWDMSGTTVSASSSETSAATTTNLAEREMTPADGTEASLRRSTRVRKQPAWLEGYHRS